MAASTVWTDFRGQQWHVSQSTAKLKFKTPCHAALRAHVFHRDGFKCCRCPAKAVNVPAVYDGREALSTDTMVRGWRDTLVVDHVVSRKAGGRNVVENLQALCETCNRRKVREDNAAAAAYRQRGLS